MTPSAAPTHLRVEHLDEAFGIDERQPRLSWRLPAGAGEQVAYRVEAGEWDSGRVESGESVLVPYRGPTLTSGQRVSWRVRVWTDLGESAWSEPGWWEMGLLDPGDWAAHWIEPAESAEARAGVVHPAYLLRGSFTLGAPPACARLYATAHGIYELFLNGERVGDMELTPGFTSYGSSLQVQTFDVGELLVPGENVLGAVLSDGWFRGQTGGLRKAKFYGERVALLAQLRVTDADGSATLTGTGPEWRSAVAAIQEADLIQGETIDLRRRRPGWCTTRAALDDWSPVAVRRYDLRRLCSSPAPPVRRVEEVRPVEVTRLAPDRHVVDLGQNINGWVRLTRLGPAGTALTLTHGEACDADGAVTVDHINIARVPRLAELPWDVSNVTLPLQVDRVTAAGEPGEAFEPRHTTHGFRYVGIDGQPADVAVDDVRGVVVHTDMRRTGWFACSDERLERLHEAAAWTLRGNACDVPTDCPTRERSGWGGDWAHFLPSAAFMYDVAGFSAKWLRDLAAEQRWDGCVHPLAPDTHTPDMKAILPSGSSAWGDAAVLVPWELYRVYGDRRILERQWSSMTAWVQYAAAQARAGRHPARSASRPVPAPHEAYIWDTGYHLGEWLEPRDDHPDLEQLATADNSDVATAYLHRSSRLLAEIASVLGREEEAERCRALAAATKAAWQAEYVGADGLLLRDTQAAYVRALAFELVPDEARPRMAERLVELIRAAGTHPSTGILATGLLLPVLADAGHLDVAYELLLQDTEPSWLTMLDRGATTIWEMWNAVDETGAPRQASQSHYALGAVVSFLHRYVAGIRPLDEAPGYRRFAIAPTPAGGLTSARAALETPYGRIESSWRIADDRFQLGVVVPPGTRAEIRLPDGQRVAAQPGSTSLCCLLPQTAHPL
ncbi:MAG TPA: family 78 glycoside hydrolase catalytic domain [Conexibacter sp.]|nr:family 78 glycoside hydrolase catalytic domain [Conexibacter sp.]